MEITFLMLRNTFRVLFIAIFIVGALTRLHAQASTDTCFDPNNASDVRLWTGPAPGAVGAEPCSDIPFMRVFHAKASGPAPAILIIPGGGYDRLTDVKEQTPVAEFFADDLKVTAFVLYYRLVQRDGTYRYPVPMWDGQRALRLIRAHAREFGVDPERIGLFGFSAGGHLASTLALHPTTDFGLPSHDDVDRTSARPAILGLGYPVISMDPADVPPSGSYRNLLKGYRGAELSHLQDYLSGEKNVNPHTPPVFLFESQDDTVISPQNSVLFVAALQRAGVPVDAHLFAHGTHGDGLAVGIADEEAWPDLFHQWLVSQKFMDRVLADAQPAPAPIQSIVWKGHRWKVTNGQMAGVSLGSANNVFVDTHGYLHLRVSHDGPLWTAAELFTTDKMGFGTYQWQIEGAIDRMDPTTVLGLFPYGPEGGIGADGENELDIEFSQWDKTAQTNADFTFYPPTGYGKKDRNGDAVASDEHDFSFGLAGRTLTTARLVWSSSSVTGTVMLGLQPLGATTNVQQIFTYAPRNPTAHIPQTALPLGINFWSFRALPAQNQEVVIRDFQFTPEWQR